MIALCEFRFQLIRNMLNLRGHVRIWNYNSQSILTTTSIFWCGRVLWHSYCSRQSWLKKWLTKIQKKPDGWVGDVAIFVVGRSQRERGRGLVGGELRGTESECHGAWWLCRIVWVVSFLLSRVENLKLIWVWCWMRRGDYGLNPLPALFTYLPHQFLLYCNH